MQADTEALLADLDAAAYHHALSKRAAVAIRAARAEADRLAEAVTLARNVFARYATMHLAKCTPDGDAKGRVNHDLSRDMSAALFARADPAPFQDASGAWWVLTEADLAARAVPAPKQAAATIHEHVNAGKFEKAQTSKGFADVDPRDHGAICDPAPDQALGETNGNYIDDSRSSCGFP